MNILQHLSIEDFKITRLGTNDVLVNVLPGLSLIMFYSNSCQHCTDIMPAFKKLPSRFPSCTFGIVNISRNMGLAESSKRTTTPIQYVPFVLLYNDGIPVAKISTENTTEDMLVKFIASVIEKQQITQSFTRGNQRYMSDANRGANHGTNHTPQESKEEPSQYIPEYLKDIGVPVCSGGVCYLEFARAY